MKSKYINKFQSASRLLRLDLTTSEIEKNKQKVTVETHAPCSPSGGDNKVLDMF